MWKAFLPSLLAWNALIVLQVPLLACCAQAQAMAQRQTRRQRAHQDQQMIEDSKHRMVSQGMMIRNTFWDGGDPLEQQENTGARRACSVPRDMGSSTDVLARPQWGKSATVKPPIRVVVEFEKDACRACAYLRSSDRRVQSWLPHYSDLQQRLDNLDVNLNKWCDILSCAVGWVATGMLTCTWAACQNNSCCMFNSLIQYIAMVCSFPAQVRGTSPRPTATSPGLNGWRMDYLQRTVSWGYGRRDWTLFALFAASSWLAKQVVFCDFDDTVLASKELCQ